MTVDLSDVSKQVRGFYNSGFTTGIACAQVAYKCLTTPTDYPVNDGSFRPLKVIMPMGTVISAERCTASPGASRAAATRWATGSPCATRASGRPTT